MSLWCRNTARMGIHRPVNLSTSKFVKRWPSQPQVLKYRKNWSKHGMLMKILRNPIISRSFIIKSTLNLIKPLKCAQLIRQTPPTELTKKQWIKTIKPGLMTPIQTQLALTATVTWMMAFYRPHHSSSPGADHRQSRKCSLAPSKRTLRRRKGRRRQREYCLATKKPQFSSLWRTLSIAKIQT